jgi:Zn-dependent peptidase ImmA (M78 family)
VLLVLEEIGIELPKEQITATKEKVDLSQSVENIAAQVREIWGLKSGPIPDVIQHIEARGVVVLPIANACSSVDAFSTWIHGRPFIMLAMQKNSSRTHFDIAHELAHLIMHEDAIPGDPKCEKEADSFASAFLMPASSFSLECPTRWSLSKFRALKKRWHTSLRALIYSAHKHGKLSSSSYRRACIELNQTYGKNEPDEWVLKRPAMLRQALEIVSHEVSLDDIANIIGLHKAHLIEILKPINEA